MTGYITQNTVNRSNRLKCICCNIPLPLGTLVWFKMNEEEDFVGTLCIECGENSEEYLTGNYHIPGAYDYMDDIDYSQD